jgi:hypothetical protein
MVVIVWILPIQMFETTVILVVAAAIGFVVLRRQVSVCGDEKSGQVTVETLERLLEAFNIRKDSYWKIVQG